MATWDLQDIDETQSEFQNGTLTDVEADSGDYLRLADTDVLSFDGSGDYVEVSDDNSLDITGNITLSAWINPNVPMNTGGDIWNSIVWKEQSYILYYDQSDDKVAAYFYGVGGTVKWTAQSGWHYVVATYDGSKTRLFVDGSLIGTSSNTGTIDTTSNPVGIGANAIDSDRDYDGEISDVRIWDIARTQSEIQNDMNNRLNGDETGLVAYYKLDEGTGTTATDSAGSNDGTINGASWVSNEPLYFMNPNEDNNRVVQLDLSPLSTYSDSLIEWTATLNNQTLTIETRYSLDGGSSWSSWLTCTNGSAIPGLSSGDDLSNALLECRETLSTSDNTSTPQLERRAIYLVEETGVVQFFMFPF